LKSFRDAPFVAGIPNSIYYREMHLAIEKVLARANVVVACDPAEPALIFGWGVGESAKDGTLFLHFLYVKHALRKFGIAKALEEELKKLPHTQVAYTCRTPPVFEAIRRRPQYVYQPFGFWREQ
jgi:GNAT superfamily N-acetyltransferase